MFYAAASRQIAPFGGVEAQTPTAATFSPDGRWVAYENGDQAGSVRSINVQPFPATGATYQLPVVETGGYRHPVWAPGGRELLYMIGGAVRFISASVSTAPVFAFGNPVRLPRAEGWQDNFNDDARQYDVMPDGQHFVARAKVGALANGANMAARPEIHVVLNWFEELKQCVPVK
jgi:hypothetical protein